MNFALIGLGFVSSRHLAAIKSVGGNLLCVLDPHDSVGHMDKYFMGAEYFSEFESFDRHCENLVRSGTKIDYVSVCSPNYLHEAHCRFGLRLGADVICEKPLTVNHKNIELLNECEAEAGKVIYPILQLRQHKALTEMKEKLQKKDNEVYIRYLTPRGKWYDRSWKSDVGKSGGVLMNIAVHFIDLLYWYFGDLNITGMNYTKGIYSIGLKADGARISCEFSIDSRFKTCRDIVINKKVVNLDGTFNDLHTQVYQRIIDHNWYGINDCIEAIKICEELNEYSV